MKTNIVVLLVLVASLYFTGCGKEVDDVINEMTLKGTVERGEKTIDKVKGFQKQYAENLKALNSFDTPTNSINSKNVKSPK